jgi:CheY-like chemotaxis protein
VLIVDDNVDSAESLAELLALSGHAVRTAHDGPAALRAAEEHRPDAVLLDIGLPRMDGYEVARRLRQLPGGPRPTLIAMTGYGQDDDRRKSHAAGFDHHLVKPVDLDDVKRLLAPAAT